MIPTAINYLCTFLPYSFPVCVLPLFLSLSYLNVHFECRYIDLLEGFKHAGVSGMSLGSYDEEV